jgi:hypothetical protein
VGLFNDQLFAGERLNLACALVPVVVGVPGLALFGYARCHYARETETG